jgi:hypothetical protein
MGWQEFGEKCIMRSFNICSLCHVIIRMMKSRRMRWAGHVARMGEKRDTYRLLVGKTEGKRPLGKTKCRSVLDGSWTDRTRCCGLDWSGSE